MTDAKPTDAETEKTERKDEELQRFLVAREQHQVRECVHDATSRAEALLVDTRMIALVNEHFMTQAAERGASEGPYSKPLVIASPLSVLRTTAAVPRALDPNVVEDRVRAPAGAWETAREAAKMGADVFVVVVEAIERTSHRLVARCVVAAHLMHARPKDAPSLPKSFAKRLAALNKCAILSPVRVHTVVRDLHAETRLVRAGAEARRVEAQADATEDAKKAAMDALGAASRTQKERHAHLDKQLKSFSEFTQRVQAFEVQQRFDDLLHETLAQTDLREQLQKRVDDAACSKPLLVLLRTRNGCLAYGARSIKFADPDKWIPAKRGEPSQMEKDVLKEAEARAGHPDAIILTIADEGYGVLYGFSIESFRYVPGVLARFGGDDADKSLRAQVQTDIDEIEKARKSLQAAMSMRVTGDAGAPADETPPAEAEEPAAPAAPPTE